MRGRALVTVTAATALALTGAVTGPAGAAVAGADPEALSDLVTVTSSDAAAWRASGGILSQRCVAGSGGSSASARVAYQGVGGVARFRLDLGEVLAGLGNGTVYYTGGRTAVVPVAGVVRRALHKHGLGKVPAGYTDRSAANADTYRQAGDLGEFLDFDRLQDPGFWTVLAADTVDGATTWTGSAVQGTDTVEFTIVARGGHVVSYRGDTVEGSCTITTSFTRPDITLPAVSTRHNRVVADEARLYRGLLAMNAFTAKKDSTTTVARLRRGATTLQGPRTQVTKIAKGVTVSYRSKGWTRPLVWKVTVEHHHAHYTPLRSRPSRSA